MDAHDEAQGLEGVEHFAHGLAGDAEHAGDLGLRGDLEAPMDGLEHVEPRGRDRERMEHAASEAEDAVVRALDGEMEEVHGAPPQQPVCPSSPHPGTASPRRKTVGS